MSTVWARYEHGMSSLLNTLPISLMFGCLGVWIWSLLKILPISLMLPISRAHLPQISMSPISLILPMSQTCGHEKADIAHISWSHNPYVVHISLKSPVSPIPLILPTSRAHIAQITSITYITRITDIWCSYHSHIVLIPLNSKMLHHLDTSYRHMLHHLQHIIFATSSRHII